MDTLTVTVDEDWSIEVAELYGGHIGLLLVGPNGAQRGVALDGAALDALIAALQIAQTFVK